ncbi:hypothetical protein F5Y01DRAFT_34989 [Xylaria sp. FL0043]|nr:hypothetical protein F5Y01DRAFT_34989 [Xylaria sp. FL0043]
MAAPVVCSYYNTFYTPRRTLRYPSYIFTSLPILLNLIWIPIWILIRYAGMAAVCLVILIFTIPVIFIPHQHQSKFIPSSFRFLKKLRSHVTPFIYALCTLLHTYIPRSVHLKSFWHSLCLLDLLDSYVCQSFQEAVQYGTIRHDTIRGGYLSMDGLFRLLNRWMD